MQFLEEQGFEITYLPVNHDGVISVEELKNAVREDTILVSLMHVNNEIGAVMPIEEAGAAIKEKNPATLFHVDAIQSYGKLEIRPKRMKYRHAFSQWTQDSRTKGVGFLYINSKAKVQPLILGGGQQNGMRSGTDNVPGIAGLGVAAELSYRDLEQKTEHLYQLKERLAEGLSGMEDVVINGMPLREDAPIL